MADFIDMVFLRTWWIYQRQEDAYASLYHWINLVEGDAWLVFAVLVLARYIRHGNSMIEITYALSFFTFGLRDFREAYAVESWLVLFKAANLAALLYLRWLVIKRYYPGSKTYLGGSEMEPLN
jgi:hypothetical protein